MTAPIPAPAPGEPAPGPAPSTEAATATPAGHNAATPPGDAQDVSSLPTWAQEHIRGLRSEAAGHRQAKSAAEQAKDGVIEAAKVALGLTEAPSPEQLADQLGQARVETRRARVEVAIARAASAHGADPDRLLDRTSFMSQVSDLDPSAPDFTTKVSDAIRARVEADPTVKVDGVAAAGTDGTTGPRRPAPDHSQGANANNPPSKGSLDAGADAYRARFGRRAPASA